MSTAYINIGSNMGDRQALIEMAVAHIEHLCGCKATLTPFIESEPWGYESTNRFLNLGISIATNLSPDELHNRLQQIQQHISPDSHRDADGCYIDRLIDIDLIAIDDITIDTEDLKLPHPRMHLRPFVLIPMLQLAPGWQHPILKKTPQEMLNEQATKHVN